MHQMSNLCVIYLILKYGKNMGAALETQRFLRNLTATLSQQEMAKEG